MSPRAAPPSRTGLLSEELRAAGMSSCAPALCWTFSWAISHMSLPRTTSSGLSSRLLQRNAAATFARRQAPFVEEPRLGSSMIGCDHFPHRILSVSPLLAGTVHRNEGAGQRFSTARRQASGSLNRPPWRFLCSKAERCTAPSTSGGADNSSRDKAGTEPSRALPRSSPAGGALLRPGAWAPRMPADKGQLQRLDPLESQWQSLKLD
jgi:hypothetical protein